MNENLTCFWQSPKLKPPETLKKWFSLFFTFLKNTGKQAFCIAKAIHETSNINNCTYLLHIILCSFMIGLYLAFIFTEEKYPTPLYSSGGSTIPNLILNKHFRATLAALLVEWQSKSSPPHLSIYGKPVGFPWKSIHNSIEDYFHSNDTFPVWRYLAMV